MKSKVSQWRGELCLKSKEVFPKSSPAFPQRNNWARHACILTHHSPCKELLNLLRCKGELHDCRWSPVSHLSPSGSVVLITRSTRVFWAPGSAWGRWPLAQRARLRLGSAQLHHQGQGPAERLVDEGMEGPGWLRLLHIPSYLPGHPHPPNGKPINISNPRWLHPLKTDECQLKRHHFKKKGESLPTIHYFSGSMLVLSSVPFIDLMPRMMALLPVTLPETNSLPLNIVNSSSNHWFAKAKTSSFKDA